MSKLLRQWLESQQWKLNSRVDSFCWQTPILMKLVSVDRALKELQNDILFVTLYCCRYKYKSLMYQYWHFKIMLEKRVSFCSSLKALSTDTSFQSLLSEVIDPRIKFPLPALQPLQTFKQPKLEEHNFKSMQASTTVNQKQLYNLVTANKSCGETTNFLETKSIYYCYYYQQKNIAVKPLYIIRGKDV